MIRRCAASFIILSVLLACNISSLPIPRPPRAGTTSTQIPHVAEDTATSEPTLQPSWTPRPSETLAPALTETLLPTATRNPTRTPLPSPTATPKGYYYSSPGAFAITLPSGWKVDEEDGAMTIFTSSADGLMLFASSEVSDSTLEDVIQEFSDPEVSGVSNAQVGKTASMTLGDGSEAETVLISGKDSSGYAVNIKLVVAKLSPRTYIFALFGNTTKFKTREKNIANLFNAIELLPGQMYGMDKKETIFLLGNEPDASELDPATATGSAGDYVGFLFSGLVRLSPQLQIVPDLAEGWTVSDDGTVYTFTLKANAAFQSGKPITAQDVRYSWERAVDPRTQSTTAHTYLGDIAGVQAMLDKKTNYIKGIRVVDDRTLVVSLDGPKPYFLAKLTYPTAFIVDPENVNSSKEWMLKPNASGPYGVRELREKEALILERNESYVNPAKVPYVVFLTYRVGTYMSLFKSGEVDIAYPSAEDIQLLQESSNPLHDQLQKVTSLCTDFIQIDNTQAPMDDINVRQAFALAIDRDDMVKNYGDNLNLPALSILPPAMPGFSANSDLVSFNIAEAKAALAKSKYAGKLPKIVLTAQGYADTDSPYLNSLVEMWKKNLGVSVSIEYVDPETFTEQSHQSHGQLVEYGWCADYPDPENFLDLLYHTENDFNVAGYSNPEIDRLLEKARTEQDTAERLKDYTQAETLLLEDYATIPIMHNVTYSLVNPRLKGYVEAPMGVLVIPWVTIDNNAAP